jgi:spore maturation protein CgeB
LKRFCEDLDSETDGRIVYEHDVSFIGSLYDNEFNFYDQIEDLPEELRLYWDDLIRHQESVFGLDLFSDPEHVDSTRLDELMGYVSFENTGQFNLDYQRVVLDILRKKVTINERKNILRELGKNFYTVMYTNNDAAPIEDVPNLGIARYMDRMPRVFHRSKININITMRSIMSGVPLRVLDVLAAGGFLLTSYTPEIEEYFKDGEDLVIARTPEEMVTLAARYLSDDEGRRQIATNGQKKVFEKFAYTKILPDLLLKTS